MIFSPLCKSVPAFLVEGGSSLPCYHSGTEDEGASFIFNPLPANVRWLCPVYLMCQIKIREADKNREEPLEGVFYGPSVEVTHTTSSHVPLTRISLYGHF